MKRAILGLVFLGMATVAFSQQYSFTFIPKGRTDSVMYIGRYYRDAVTLVDTAKGGGGRYVFKGRKKWERGMYALVAQDGKKVVGDFCVDGSLKFSISGDENLSAESVTVKGCAVNKQMFEYVATEKAAKREMDSLRTLKKSEATRQAAEEAEKKLIERMEAYEEKAMHPKNANVFFELQEACAAPDVPEEVEDKATWYRMHYWDKVFEGERLKVKGERWALMHSPQMFSKMNYFFYGVLYYAASDTIIADLDRLMAKIGDDTAMARYVLGFIEPKYFRSTKNVGWDAVWCHIASSYYLKGRCPWATEGTLHNMRYNYNRIRQSLIGAHGQELWMADTNQSSDPKDWISSHRFPTRYVILWFWDPDCHHCQEQSAALKVLYDSLATAPDKRFEVYAVGYESDVEKWKGYVREHDFRWVNVGGTNVNIDYQEAYNVHGAPTMIILNENRDIIMNKVLPAKSLLQFLDNYEKREAEASLTKQPR